MIQKLVGPNAVTQCELERRTGVRQTTLSRWLREAANGGAVKKKRSRKASATAGAVAARPAERSAEDRLRIVGEASRCNDDELGALLRREGIHESTLDEWRNAALEALKPGPKNPNRKALEIRDLERELRRKDKALAEAAALLMLQKKVQALLAVADDDTDENKDE
jgi:transposase